MSVANITNIKEAGFTATYTGLIACLAKCDQMQLYPIINWYSHLYSNDKDENIFYKYFELINYANKPDIITNTINMGTWEQLSQPRMEWRKILCAAYTNHVKLRPEFVTYIDNVFNKINNIPLIGVHIRNTDRAIEPAWASPGITYVIDCLIKVLKEYNNTETTIGLYIASDNIPDVVLLKDTITKISNDLPTIIYIEDPKCVRSPDQTSVHGNLDSGLTTVSNDEKALSILTDIYCLARCKKVVRTCSNVTSMVGIISPTTIFIDVSLECGKQSDEWLQVQGI